jgi:5-methylcytosine-specific restriction protein A
MGWETSDRRGRLPGNWDQLRRKVLRDAKHACQVKLGPGRICGKHATEVDHIRAGDDHSFANLRAICSDCHGRKSSAEGNAARRQRRKEISQRFRRTEQHPGLL